jgi:acetyl-CoA synthetase
MTPYQRFIEARDFLQAHRTDYDVAYHGYIAPVLNEFNWALDYFDIQAKDNPAPPGSS